MLIQGKLERTETNLMHFLTLYRPAMPLGNRKKIEDLFSSVLSQFKKYHPSGNLKFYNLGILKSLNLGILVEKNPSNFS